MTSRVKVLNGTTETKALIPTELVSQPSATNAKVMNIYTPVAFKIIIIDEIPTEATKSNSDEYAYHPDVETDDESSDDVGLNCIRPMSSTHLPVVKCVPSPLTKKIDWRRL